MGVGVVASQKVIHPRLIEALVFEVISVLPKYVILQGILALERLSIIHIDTFRKITGASLIGTTAMFFQPGAATASLEGSFGMAGTISKWKCGNKKCGMFL